MNLIKKNNYSLLIEYFSIKKIKKFITKKNEKTF